MIRKSLTQMLILLLFSWNVSAKGNIMETQDITRELILNVPITTAWSYWTDSALLEKWLTTKAHVEPKLNGLYELFWDPNHPEQNSTKGCRVTGLASEKIISFEWKGPTPFADIMNTNPLPTWVVVTFESIDASKTIIHFRHSGWKQGEKWKAAREWQEQAWNEGFKELLALAKK